MTQDDLLIKLFEEVEYIWPKMGYPPLVTPYSQYVKNTALMNVISVIKGKERFTMIDDNTWDMLLGNQGKLPGELAPELKQLAKEQGREFFTGNPQDLYPDELDKFKKEMDENGWDYGKDDEELMELAMHPVQYRNYKSGKAKQEFEEDLAKKRAEASSSTPTKVSPPSVSSLEPKTLNVDVNGEKFIVSVSYGDAAQTPPPSGEKKEEAPTQADASSNGAAKEITAPLEGSYFRTKDSSEKPLKTGDTVKKGQAIADGPCTQNGELALGRVMHECGPAVARRCLTAQQCQDARTVLGRIVRQPHAQVASADRTRRTPQAWPQAMDQQTPPQLVP